MGNTSQIGFEIINKANAVESSLADIAFVEGITIRGPVNDPDIIVTSLAQFLRIFGGYSSTNYFPLICGRMLNRGVKLRVNRITDGTETTATLATYFLDGTDNLFKFNAKYPGADYNNISIAVKAASNGGTNYFNVEVTHATDPNVYELYENLLIDELTTAANSDYLSEIAAKSDFIVPVYADLSLLTLPLRPANASKDLATGSNGGTVDVNDYIGSSATKTGFYAFDGYDDSYVVAVPAVSESDMTGISAGGENYASTRKDIQYFQHIDLTNVSAANIISERTGTNLDSRFISFFSGGVKVLDPLTSEIVYIPEVGDVISCMIYTISTVGAWYAFHGPNRGIFKNALGVVNNFGDSGSFADLNLIANNQINMAVNRDNKIMIWDGYTAARQQSPLNFISVNNLLFYLQKSLRPALEYYLGEPNDIPTWKQMSMIAKTFLNRLVENRGLWSYTWNGDQDVKDLDSLKVNNKTDVLAGKYVIELEVTPIAPLVQMTIKIIITPGGVQFSV